MQGAAKWGCKEEEGKAVERVAAWGLGEEWEGGGVKERGLQPWGGEGAGGAQRGCRRRRGQGTEGKGGAEGTEGKGGAGAVALSGTPPPLPSSAACPGLGSAGSAQAAESWRG